MIRIGKALKRLYTGTFGRLSFSAKLVIGFLIIVVIPIYFIFNLQYSITAKEVVNEIASVLSSISDNQASEINDTFEAMNKTGLSLKNDIYLQNLLLNGCKNDVDADYMDTIYRLYSNSDTRLVLYASSVFFSGKYGRQFGFIKPYSQDNYETPKDFVNSSDEMTRGYFSENEKMYITLSDVFRDQKGVPFGSFEIVLKEESLYKRMLKLSSSADDYYLVNNTYVIVSSSKRINLGTTFDDRKVKTMIEGGYSNQTIDGRRIIKKNLVEENWYLIKELNMAQFEGRVVYARGATILVFFFIITIIIIAGLLFSRSVSRRLKGLAIAMYHNEAYTSELVSDEEAPDQFFNEGDEVDSLIRGYHRLRSQIQSLINDVYKADNEKVKAKLQTLQEQINPHFLYNILDSIKSCIELGKVTEANKMIQSLSRFYRRTLSGGLEKITIRNEIEIAIAYTELQQMCYEDHFDLVINIPDNLKDFVILKFSLQPIIENSINYAFADIPRRGMITISADMWGDDILIYIRDNGVGIPKEKIDEIKAGLKNETTKADRGYGLRNVNARLKLHYGKGYGIIGISSNPEKGTEIKICIPQEV